MGASLPFIIWNEKGDLKININWGKDNAWYGGIKIDFEVIIGEHFGRDKDFLQTSFN